MGYGRGTNCEGCILDSQVIYRRMDGESVLVHLPTDRIFVLNDTGARIWELLQETDDHAEVRRRLSEEFDAAPGIVESELNTFLAQLKALQLGDDGDR